MPVAEKIKHPSTPPAGDLLPPRILAVDDERQIHSSLRLRLGKQYELVCASGPHEALAAIHRHRFDLCIVDIHMPEMDGLAFIEAAREIDPALGYVILSAYDSGENLRRAIPLQVFEFLSKPFPERAGFEDRVLEWVSRTRAKRRETELARSSDSLFRDLDVARIEKEVESTASAFAREALLQAAGALTTTQALLLNALQHLESDPRRDPVIAVAKRSVVEARKQADAAAKIAEGYFSSAYADRESSPALLDTCMKHAIGLSLRVSKAEERQKRIDYQSLGTDTVLADLSGIDLLLALVPAIAQALDLAPAGSTVQVRCEEVSSLDGALEDARLRRLLWVNRRHALTSHPGIMVSIRSSAPSLDQEVARNWLQGSAVAAMQRSSRGVIRGIQLAKGLVGLAVKPEVDRFALIFLLRV